jgi:hypothetical protein
MENQVVDFGTGLSTIKENPLRDFATGMSTTRDDESSDPMD